MTRAGCDFSFARPSVATLKAAGMTFVARYVSVSGAGKNLTRGEVAAYRAAGIDIAVVFETTASRALAGTTGGAADARSALSQVLALGGPADVVIYFAVDWDVNAAEMTRVNAYLAGASSVLGLNHTGVYGSYRCVQMALDAGIVDYAWQTYAWSGGKWDRRAQLQQYRNGYRLPDGSEVDLCRAVTDDFGQWGGRTGDDMSAADVAAINAHTDAKVKELAGQIGFVGMALQADTDKLVAALKPLADDEAKVLGAISALPTAGMTDAQVAVLAGKLNIDPGKLADAVAHRFGAALMP